MNILIINHYAGSPVHGMEYRHYYLARHFVESGHKVNIVAASYSHLRNRAPEAKGSVAQEVIDGIRYWWLRTSVYQGNGAGRVLNMMQFGAMLLTKRTRIAADCLPDLIIASSPHPFVIFGAVAIARACGAKLAFEVRDLWPLTLVEIGGVTPAHPFVRFMQWAEDFAYRRADFVISLLPKAKEYMVSRGMRPEKFNYIPNGIELAEWKEYESGADLEACCLIRKLKQEGFFVVGYVGAHGLANALNVLLETALLMNEERVAFVLVGQGPEKERLKKKSDKLGLRNVHFLSPVAKSFVPSVLAEMDLLYLGWKKDPLYRFGISPNKLMDYMISAKPILHSVSAANDAVAESGCGISVPPEDPDAISRAIRKMMPFDISEKHRMGLKGYEYVIQHHDYRRLAAQCLDLVI